jgi:predicted GTPase
LQIIKGSSYHEDVFNFFLQTKNNDEAIDFIETTFFIIEKLIGDNPQWYSSVWSVKITPVEAVEDLNQRFKEHGVGYQFEGGEIIRLDSMYMHTEVVKPVISLLWTDTFRGACEEYMNGHDHYKLGRNKECLVE